MLASVLLSLVLLSSSRAVSSWDSSFDRLVVRSELPSIPSGFVARDIASLSTELVHLTIALPQVNITGLHATLLDVSDPSSSRYGRHLSKREVERLVSPQPESLRAVTDWLTSNGVKATSSSASGDMVSLRVPVERANALLGANFTTYIHEDTNTTMIRTLSYSVPAHLYDHINLIYPTNHFVPPVKRRSRSAVSPRKPHVLREAGVPSDCAQTITPMCLQDLYHIPSAPAKAPNNSLYVSGFGAQVASKEDLQGFLSLLRPDFKNGTFNVLSLGDTPDSDVGTDEADFDIQYTVGLATNVPTTFFSTAGHTDGIILEDLLDTVNYLLAQDEVPLVLTTSYLFVESEVGTEFAQAVCNAYAQLGARGTSVIFASGDCGVSGGFLNNPANCNNKAFVPTFPSTCPYVTSVGATQGINPEVGAPFTSGGFSNIFPRPPYQDEAVGTYVGALGDTYTGLYNSSGRAYPDVSMQGVGYMYNLGGQFQLAYGTSTSTPAFASVIALLNDRLLSAGKGPLGFLNPLLYSSGTAAAFNDITSGNNPGCGTDGFYADVGWDPVTGLGTPNYDELLSAVAGDDVAHSNRNTQNDASTIASMTPLRILAWTMTVVLLLYNDIS